ncbi:MAG: PEP-CTERM sorting domain-containing protein [Rhodospirillaceae bacterium]|nr:PEP-CTERM sorting domain-containing protein [Rhodospirillaceae bacterium]
MNTKWLGGAVVAATMICAGSAQAAPVLGSNVEASVFTSMFGSTSGWSYSGQSVAAFTGTGTATLVGRSSSYANGFGYSDTAHGGRTTIFNTGAAAGSTAAVTGYAPSYLFYFQADGADAFLFSDDNRQYTDGYDSGSFPGEIQGGIDIFFNAALSQWAFFFDDAGGGLPVAGDDNDYDDMVVSFQVAQAPDEEPDGVPEPGALALFGLALLGFGAARRLKNPAPASRTMA